MCKGEPTCLIVYKYSVRELTSQLSKSHARLSAEERRKMKLLVALVLVLSITYGELFFCASEDAQPVK